jgi:hypothetical protein
MCRVNPNNESHPDYIGIEENIYEQLVQGGYEQDDYILIDSHGEIQAVSGNSEFWDDGILYCPPKDKPYIIVQLKAFVAPSEVK